MRSSDWSSDVCSSDLAHRRAQQHFVQVVGVGEFFRGAAGADVPGRDGVDAHAVLGPFDGEVAGHLVHRGLGHAVGRADRKSTSELQSLMRSSYAVFCLKKKNNNKNKLIQSTSNN